jgi:hypothetical protein
VTSKRIVYTRPDGGVSIYQPAPEFMAWLSCGGYWRDKPRGWVDEWISRRANEGRREWAVAALARLAQHGGCTSAEAFAALRDFDCIHLGTGCEACDASDLPRDRWFRNAWRRSHNGGPISIDMKAARAIQFRRIKAAAERENKRRAAEIDLFDSRIDLPFGALRDRIHKAESAAELRRVWPRELAA